MNKCLSRLLVTSFAFIVGFGVVGLRKSIEYAWRFKQLQAQTQGQVYLETPRASPSTTDELDTLQSLSPYDIEVFVNGHPHANLEKLWQHLGIHGPKFAGGWQAYPDNSKFFADCHGCSAESFEYNLDDEGGNEVLLRIDDPLSESCRYLVFKYLDRGNSWKLLGHVDYDFGRYRMPQHFIVLCDGKAWLAITGQGVSGAGVALYFDRLFLVERGVLREVMQYTSEGHQSGIAFEPQREFSGRILDCRIGSRIATIEIEFTVTYLKDWNLPHQAILFTKRQRVSFVRKLSHKMFTLDATRSDLSESELNAVYNIDSLTSEGFLKYNFKELSRLATGADLNGKEWLKQFLDHCNGSQEEQRLRSLLTSH